MVLSYWLKRLWVCCIVSGCTVTLSIPTSSFLSYAITIYKFSLLVIFSSSCFRKKLYKLLYTYRYMHITNANPCESTLKDVFLVQNCCPVLLFAYDSQLPFKPSDSASVQTHLIQMFWWFLWGTVGGVWWKSRYCISHVPFCYLCL